MNNNLTKGIKLTIFRKKWDSIKNFKSCEITQKKSKYKNKKTY